MIGRSVAGVASTVAVVAAVAGGVAVARNTGGGGATPGHRSTPSPSGPHRTVDGIADGTDVQVTGTVSGTGRRVNLCLGGGGMVLDSMPSADPVCGDYVILRDPHQLLAGADRHRRTVTGSWLEGEIDVTNVAVPPRRQRGDRLAHVPCPTPPGGWAHLQNYSPQTPNIDYTAYNRWHRDHRQVVTEIASMRPSNLHPVLTLASTQPKATRAALSPYYPAALCVVRSHYTLRQVQGTYRRAQHALFQHELPGVYQLGKQISRAGQPVIIMGARNDRPELDRLISSAPTGLIHLHVLIKVVSAP